MKQNPSAKPFLAWIGLVYYAAVLLTGLVFTYPAAAQATPELTPTQTPTPVEVIPRQDIPGNTTVLTFAAAGLVLIAVGAVLWHSRSAR